MKFSRLTSIALSGQQLHEVQIECHITQGLPAIILTADGDKVFMQARNRVRSALQTSGLYSRLRGRIHICVQSHISSSNYVSQPLRGRQHDFAIAMALVFAVLAQPSRVLEPRGAIFIGNLHLDGSITAVPEVLAHLLAAYNQGYQYAFVSAEHKEYISRFPIVNNMRVYAVQSLSDVVDFLEAKGEVETLAYISGDGPPSASPEVGVGVSSEWDPLGFSTERFLLTVAAVGKHNISCERISATKIATIGSVLQAFYDLPEMEQFMEHQCLHELLVDQCARPGSGDVLDTCAQRTALSPHIPWVHIRHQCRDEQILTKNKTDNYMGKLLLAGSGFLMVDQSHYVSPHMWSLLYNQYARRSHKGDATTIQVVTGLPRCLCSEIASGPCICNAQQRKQHQARMAPNMLSMIDIHIPFTSGLTVLPLGTQQRPSLGKSNSATQWASNLDEDFRPAPDCTVHELANFLLQLSFTRLKKLIADSRGRSYARWGKKNAANSTISLDDLIVSIADDPEVYASVAHITQQKSYTEHEVRRLLQLAWTIADICDHSTLLESHIRIAQEIKENK